MAEENIIELERVDAGYPGAVILKDVSFAIRRGEVFILLGGSGCGKSTIMKHMIGLNPILAGRLTVAGMEWGRRTRAALCRKIGVMYQSGALFGSMTCLENVMLPLEEFTRMKQTERRARAMALLKDVEMGDAADKLPSEISGTFTDLRITTSPVKFALPKPLMLSIALTLPIFTTDLLPLMFTYFFVEVFMM